MDKRQNYSIRYFPEMLELERRHWQNYCPNELELNDLDILEINASRTNSVDDVRDKIVNFVQMIPFGDFKVVLLDEADYLSPNAQAALRGVMEEYHTTARFIQLVIIPTELFHYTVGVYDSI